MSIDRRKMPLRASVQANLSRQAVRSDLPIRPLERVEPVKDGGIRVFALFVLGCAIVAVVLFVFQLWLSPWLADEIGTLEYGKVRTSQYDVTLPDGYQAHFLAINLKSKAVIVEMLGYAGKIITYEGMSVASDRMVGSRVRLPRERRL